MLYLTPQLRSSGNTVASRLLLKFVLNARRVPDFQVTTRSFASGGLGGLRTRLCEFARERGQQDILAVLPSQTEEVGVIGSEQEGIGDQALVEGFVYLIKSGRHFKIGKANSVESRHRQLRIQLPQAAAVVHRIRTDDPYGIESYWHRRFADKRLNGEWFALSVENVKLFKRRKFM